MTTTSHLTDPRRLDAVDRLALDDPDTRAALDRFTRLAARIVDAPISLLSILTDERNVFASHVGIPEAFAAAGGVPLSSSICHEVVRTGRALVVDDAATHPLTRDHPALAQLGIGAYAGVPVRDVDDLVLGSFCVVDRVQRTWSDEQCAALEDLAAAVMAELRLRQRERELDRARLLQDQFLSLVSHELRTPLAALVGSVELLQEEAAEGEIDEEARWVVDSLDRNTRRLRRLVEDLLLGASLEADRVTWRMDELDPTKLLRECVDAARTRTGPDVQVELDLPPQPLPRMRGDRQRLAIALDHVIGNAITHAGAGVVVVHARRDDGELVVDVRDAGPGIGPSRHERVFERFVRADAPSGVNATPGLGLGLPTSRAIARAHGGSVQLEPARGIGTTVRFRLPLPTAT